MKSSDTDTAMRLDKWLWAARFFKTRSLAQKHIELGRVRVNGDKVKNSKNIGTGDIIDLTLNSLPYKIKVLALNHQRRPAPEARQLYQEDMKTAELREQQKLLDQAGRSSAAYPDGRPTKRDRRQIDKVKRGDW
ncbi:RNA-binding S4 domain-containing protein [Uruburuella testudinis]|uniref:RNA-binding S4 domain-containing protein n=1 Tax=Uruburuella testudinis TaxID=1282863 RepID=A0ABY4DNX3_9NEIS|nr:RNA-binding S4 domain-containing protein [Uruburuella testudinis]UOO80763.1 RNA-binding S4 domain-containing protein [Uruburuella testudinis]